VAEGLVRYRTIVADPPWPYGDAGKQHSVIPRCIKSDGQPSIGVADWTYAPMSMAAICDLNVQSITESDSHLYLWTTNAFMEQAHQVARSWGFETKTILTWGKVCQDDHLKPSMKTGFYYRGASEHILFCVRGSLRLTGTWPTLFLWPRIGKHSHKPDAFYDLVEQASPGPYVELFARRHRFGWDVWGNESANTAEMPA
jgi:N6-adenosine-specific RNA methylase IME4